MEIQKNKTYTNPNGRKMTVNVLDSFKEILEMNDKAIEIVSKRKEYSDKVWKKR